MKFTSRPVLCIAAALTVGLVGCGSDDASDASADDSAAASSADAGATGEGTTEVCAGLQDISDFEMSSMNTLASADPADWPALQAALVGYSTGLAEHYDPAIASADEEISSDLTKLRDASSAATSSAADAPSYEAFNEQSTTSIDADTAQAAIDASTRVDQYAQNTCGFSINQQQDAPQQAPAPAPAG
ncbi:hypothetical protein [Rhodococcoides yunnanense]|uniref:hypothetical protein n=1 Tax=Rhodococcoides yunnanense TaxID=278209 RepID=UPI0009331580|nr:hypothetical protein [Rhodococcus yunnanensis]